jgi:uncharacterized membrane protein YqjE
MDQADAPVDEDGKAQERPLVDELRALAAQGEAYARAELDYQKARAAFAGQELRAVAISGVLALFFVFFALMALTVGTLFSLVPVLSPWGATAATFGALVVLAGLCAALAAWRFSRMRRALADKGRSAAAKERR